MEKQFKIFGFVVFLAIIGVGVFAYINTKKQTELLKSKIEISETSASDSLSRIENLSSTITNIDKRIRTLEMVINRVNQTVEDEKSRALQARQEEENRKESEKLVAEAKEKEKQQKAEEQAAKAKVAPKAPVKPAAKPASKTSSKTKSKAPVKKSR